MWTSGRPSNMNSGTGTPQYPAACGKSSDHQLSLIVLIGKLSVWMRSGPQRKTIVLVVGLVQHGQHRVVGGLEASQGVQTVASSTAILRRTGGSASSA